MKAIKQWYFRRKLRSVIAALAHRTNVPEKQQSGVHDFAKMLEATEIMSRGVKNSDMVRMECTRGELDTFIRYMTTLHDSRLSLLIRARIGLATLFMSDKEALGEDPKAVLGSEHARRLKGSEANIVDASGKQIKVKL